MTITRSVTWSIKLIRCSTTSMATPPSASARNRCATWSSSPCVSPAASSSTHSRRGPVARARARSSIFCWTELSSEACLLASRSSSTEASSAFEVHRRPAAVSRGDFDVLAHGQRHERFRRLECARHAEMDDSVRRQAADIAAAKNHPAGQRPVEAGDDIDAGGLARPVGADQPQHFAGGDVKTHAGQGAKAAKRLDQILHTQERRCFRGHRSPSA